MADVNRVFTFFLQPAQILALSPPDLQLRLLSAPDVLQLGSRIEVQVRRWGMTRRIMTEITRLEEGTLLVEEQREGPFRSWVHTRWFEAVPQGGTRLTEPIEYEPPTGMLGLMLTSALVDRELGWAYVYRAEALAKLLTSGAQGT